MSVAVTELLSDDLLARCAERAAGYDRENTFFTEDFEELKGRGYLSIALPQEFGGPGLDLAGVCAQQRRLAHAAPATALAINMHLYWTGVAADRWRAGDRSLEWILAETAQGEVFAAGHGERGNDMPLLLSTATAERVDGGYRFSGHKIFGSLSPVWTRLGIHAMDVSDPANPMVVHAFMPRDTPGYTIVETWDTLGMRPTRSDDTILDGAFVPDSYIARVIPAGLAGAEEFVLSVFAWAQCTFGSIYIGLAERAFELAVADVAKKTSIALEGKTMAHHPMLQHEAADMYIELESMRAHVDRTAADWSAGIGHEDWPAKLVA
ncbi:MAG TPA: acyl-CoA dehydrogenase family protein, partial [Acidimicrobiales bacterium]|nr:acyl-CoA dehydrogenase family protein [Acidimicrobiales bacterium]